MAMVSASKASGSSPVDLPDLRLFVFALFFIFGGITSLNDVVIPKLKGLFTLSYGEVMLVQSAFFTAYFLISLPAAAIVRRVGYLRTAALGLLMMTAGCLLFIPASSSGLFGMFLAALFVLAAGITIVQVVANPLISMLGPPATAHSRLTFAQAFNSLGTTIFPYVGSILILGPPAPRCRRFEPRRRTSSSAPIWGWPWCWCWSRLWSGCVAIGWWKPGSKTSLFGTPLICCVSGALVSERCAFFSTSAPRSRSVRSSSAT
jgi:MFS family permease